MEKIIMIDVYGMKHIFDNNFSSLDEAEQWAFEHDYRVSRKFTVNKERNTNEESHES